MDISYTTEYYKYVFAYSDSDQGRRERQLVRERIGYEEEPCFKKSIPLDDELKRLKRKWPRGLKFEYL